MDGDYADPDLHQCAGYFYKCSGGVMFKFQCPPSLFFDAVRDACEYRENVTSCFQSIGNSV
jgi:Chitin binding Peritrophin-A domain